MNLAEIAAAARGHALVIRGALHPGPEDAPSDGCGTLILLGPDEPRFWRLFAGSPEYGDGAPDPLDRWSGRMMGDLAATFGGTSHLPYDGPPFAPFIRWALDSGACWSSPTGLLVHHRAGLMLSFRGALAVPQRLDIDERPAPPCPVCAARPCATACPVGALRPDQHYDAAACRAHVTSDAGRDCRWNGCMVRRACPLSQHIRRDPAQAAFHMAAFVKD